MALQLCHHDPQSKGTQRMTDQIMRRSLSSPKQGYAFTALVCLFSAGLSSLSHASEMLHWKDAWVRSMPPGAQVTAAYGMLMNHSDQTVTLSTVSSEISGSAQMHEVIADGDQRRMAELSRDKVQRAVVQTRGRDSGEALVATQEPETPENDNLRDMAAEVRRAAAWRAAALPHTLLAGRAPRRRRSARPARARRVEQPLSVP